MSMNSNLYPSFIKKQGTKSKALFALGLVCFFWGTTWIASRQGVLHMPALQMAGLRQFLGGIVYVIYFMSKGRAAPNRQEIFPILTLAFFNFTMSNGLSTWGVKYISAGLGSIIGATFPLWVVVIGFFSKKNKVPPKALVGFLLGFAGVCVIFSEHLHDFLDPNFVFGIILSFIAIWSWAFGTIYTKKQAKTFNPYFSLGWQMVLSGSFLMLVAKVTGYSIPISEIPLSSWIPIAYLVVFGSVISFIAYLYALQRLSAEQASVYAYINPIVAILLGALLFDEKLTIFIAIGGAITILGVYIINQALKKSKV
jgi:drug/metabolite transporter (DMT)-like permease